MKIVFTKKEIRELLWIVSEYKNTHEDLYIDDEKEIVESLINKIREKIR